VHRWEFLGAREKEVVFGRLGSPVDWQKVTPADLETWLGRPVRARWDTRESLRRLQDDERFLEHGGFVVVAGEPEFPAVLAEIADPPWLLWGRGTLPELGNPWVAVVGTRFPSEPGRRAGHGFARELAEAGTVVVSGLARGVDAQAHWGCTGHGPSVGVLGNGIDTVSPAGNQRLAARLLAEGGCLLSEYGPGEPALPYRFVARNRLISGLPSTKGATWWFTATGWLGSGAPEPGLWPLRGLRFCPGPTRWRRYGRASRPFGPEDSWTSRGWHERRVSGLSGGRARVE